MTQLKNFYYLENPSYQKLRRVTNDEILFNYGQKRPYGVILSIDQIDYYVPLTHDLRLGKHPFLESATYRLPSKEKNYPYSGFDFQHVLPIKDSEYRFILDNQLVGKDQRLIATQEQDKIAEKLELYIENYKNYILNRPLKEVNGKAPDVRTFKVSTLHSFHNEINLNRKISLDKSYIQELLSQESELSLSDMNESYKRYDHQLTIDTIQNIYLILSVEVEKDVDYVEDSQISPWYIDIYQNDDFIGTLCYGENWSNDFNIEYEIENLEMILSNHDYERLYSKEDLQEFIKANQEKFDLLNQNEPLITYESQKIPIQIILSELNQLPDGLLSEKNSYMKDFALPDGMSMLRFKAVADKPYPSLKENQSAIFWSLELQYQGFIDEIHRQSVSYGKFSELSDINDSLEHLQQLYDSRNLSALYPIEEADRFLKDNTDMYKSLECKMFIHQLPIYSEGERITLEQNLSGIDYALDTVAEYMNEYGQELVEDYDNLVLYDLQDPTDIVCISSNPKEIVNAINNLDVFERLAERLYDFSLVPSIQDNKLYAPAIKQAEIIFTTDNLEQHFQRYPEQLEQVIRWKKDRFYDKYYDSYQTPISIIGLSSNLNEIVGITKPVDGKLFFADMLTKLQSQYRLFTTFPSGKSPSDQVIEYLKNTYPELTHYLKTINKNQLNVWLSVVNDKLQDRQLKLHYVEITGERPTQNWQVYLIQNQQKESNQEIENLLYDYLPSLYKDEIQGMNLIYWNYLDTLKVYPINLNSKESSFEQISNQYPQIMKNMQSLMHFEEIVQSFSHKNFRNYEKNIEI